ncbi:MAG TPA: nuclear transport factor 2 family protein, partial [Opitutaceae bacterium]
LFIAGSLHASEWLYLLRLVPRLHDDKAWTPDDNAAVGRHFQHLKAATAKGQVVFAGRTMEPGERTFGVVVFEAPDEDTARRFMESDPAVVAGVMTAELHPYALALARDRAAVAAGDEADAIRQPALDYAMGWYTGDAERMERALHPELAKRHVVPVPEKNRVRVESMGAMFLVQGTRAGLGKRPEAERRADIRIVDRYEDMAMVRVDMGEWVDYLQVARTAPGHWRIVNVLWQTRPAPNEISKQ